MFKLKIIETYAAKVTVSSVLRFQGLAVRHRHRLLSGRTFVTNKTMETTFTTTCKTIHFATYEEQTGTNVDKQDYLVATIFADGGAGLDTFNSGFGRVNRSMVGVPGAERILIFDITNAAVN